MDQKKKQLGGEKKIEDLKEEFFKATPNLKNIILVRNL